MTSLLSAPTGKYLLEPAPEYLYQEATEWLSEFEFFKTELAFLSNLMNVAFLRVTTRQKLNDFNRLSAKLNLFREVFLQQLHDELIIHERHLAALDLDRFSLDKDAIHEEHQAKFARVKSFMKDIKGLKMEIFSLVEKQMRATKKITKEFEEGILSL